MCALGYVLILKNMQNQETSKHPSRYCLHLAKTAPSFPFEAPDCIVVVEGRYYKVVLSLKCANPLQFSIFPHK